MKPRIERLLIWFSDLDEKLSFLSVEYFGMSKLITRLLNENYNGNRIKFINIYFRTNSVYEVFPKIKRSGVHYGGGDLFCNDVFDYQYFYEMHHEDQKKYIWQKTFDALRSAVNQLENEHLGIAVEVAYVKGIKIGFNPDYKLLESNLVLHGKEVNASVWLNFKSDAMLANFVLEQNGKRVFERYLDKASIGNEFFMIMYTKIISDGTNVIIKGKRDVEYLPLTIQIDSSCLK